MATTHTWIDYKCNGDCYFGHCEGHQAQLYHYRTTDSYMFKVDGDELFFGHEHLEAVVQLLRQLELFGLKEN